MFPLCFFPMFHRKKSLGYPNMLMIWHQGHFSWEQLASWEKHLRLNDDIFLFGKFRNFRETWTEISTYIHHSLKIVSISKKDTVFDMPWLLWPATKVETTSSTTAWQFGPPSQNLNGLQVSGNSTGSFIDGVGQCTPKPGCLKRVARKLLKSLLLKCSFEVETVKDVVNYNSEGVSQKKSHTFYSQQRCFECLTAPLWLSSTEDAPDERFHTLA